jgi:hypothetical protein
MTHLGWYGVPPPIALRQLVARVTAGDPLSNGRLEGTNNKLGLVKRMGPTDSSTPKTSPPAAHSSAQAHSALRVVGAADDPEPGLPCG